MPFENHADITLIDEEKDLWEVDTPLVYKDAAGIVYTVPEGYVSHNMASIPRLPLMYLVFKGPDTHRPGILHDYLCTLSKTGDFKRSKADDLFYEALRSEGVGVVRARMMWSAVRLAGMVT